MALDVSLFCFPCVGCLVLFVLIYWVQVDVRLCRNSYANLLVD